MLLYAILSVFNKEVCVTVILYGSTAELASDRIHFPADMLETPKIKFSGSVSLLYPSRSEAGVGIEVEL